MIGKTNAVKQGGGGLDENTLYISKFLTKIDSMFQSTYALMRNADVTLDLTMATNVTSMMNTFRTAQPHSITIVGSTANITRFDGAFKENGNYLKTVGELDFTSATVTSAIFEYTDGLEVVIIKPETLSVSTSFINCQRLTEEGLAYIVAGLKDMTGETSPTLTLHATPKAKLTAEQIATITAKNWTLA